MEGESDVVGEEVSAPKDPFTTSLLGTYAYADSEDNNRELDELTLDNTGGKLTYTAKRWNGHNAVAEHGTFTTNKKNKLTLTSSTWHRYTYTVTVAQGLGISLVNAQGKQEDMASKAAPPKPPTPPGGVLAPKCLERTGGALITFDVKGEQIIVWSTNAEFNAEAEVLNRTKDQRTPNFDVVVDGTDCDLRYSWHVDPAKMAFADFTTEVCDGLPSYVEANKSTWMKQVGRYCPWGPTVVDFKKLP